MIVVLGELDCREGLQQAVDKSKHQDLEAAIQGLASLYMAVLDDLQRQRHLTDVWISPVPAVMEETAAIVQKFNTLMQAQVRQGKERHPLSPVLLND